MNLSTSWDWIYTHVSVFHFLIPLIADLLFFALLIFLGIVFFKKQNKYFKPYLFFCLWFLLGLSLYLQFIPLDATVAERWFYFPIVGLLGIIGVILQVSKINLKNKYVIALFSIIILIFCVRTILRSLDYRDNFTIVSHDLKISKDDYSLENNLSVIYFDRRQLDEAKQHAEKSIKIFPNIANYTSLGGIEFRLGNYKAAKEAFLKAISFGDFYSAYYNLAGLGLFYGDPKENINYIRDTVLKKYPYQGAVWVDLAILEYGYGDKEKATLAAESAKKYGSSQLIDYIYATIINSKPLGLEFNNGQVIMPEN